MKKLVVGTRGSKLAVIQTEWVVREIEKVDKNCSFQIAKIETKGDRKLNIALPKLSGGDIFLAEIEQGLLNKTIDFAVHSLKDIPVELPDGLSIACIPKREDPGDVLLQKDNLSLNDLPKGAVVGTSSVRRAAQLLAKRPDLKTDWIRGPIDSRVQQMLDGKYDAIILAAAGLNRLKIGQEYIAERLSLDEFVPAMGQGALAIECLTDNTMVHNVLAKIDDKETKLSVETERAFLACFKEGEQAPIGGYAFVQDGMIHLHGMVISLDGQTVIHHKATGHDPHTLASMVANQLMEQGAQHIIADVKRELADS